MFSKIISDSSSSIFEIADIAYANVPLKIHTSQKEYVDTPDLDVNEMTEDLRKYKGKSGSSCPNIHDWLQAFGDAEECYCVTISSNLSGSYSAAMQAAEEYTAAHPERHVFVFDSLSAGPEMQLIIEKIRECLLDGMDFDATVAAVREYQKHTRTLFCLQSLNNLARNGRVNPAVAKIAGVLGIRVIGQASDHGTLEMLNKVRGERKAMEAVFAQITGDGFRGGRLRISHCQNLESAEALRDMAMAIYPDSDVEILPCTALCSFYAERGGLIIGFEGA